MGGHRRDGASERADRSAGSFSAVLFDWAGVMTTSLREALERAGQHSRGGPGGLGRLFELEGGRERYHSLERGQLSIAEFLAWAEANEPGAADTFDPEREAFFLRHLQTRPEMVATTQRLRRAGFAVALVTNNVREWGPAWRATLPADELFDAVIDSSAVGSRKPEPRIYQLALEALGGVASERAVFLDDSPVNVAGAEAVGLTAIQVDTDAAPALARLGELVGELAAEHQP